MKKRVLAVLVCLAVTAFLVPLRAGQRGVDETRWRVRIVVSNVDVVKASLETSGYDVLETNSADSSLELVVSAAEIRTLERSGFTVVPIEKSRPLEQVLQPKETRGRISAAALAPDESASAVPSNYRNLEGRASTTWRRSRPPTRRLRRSWTSPRRTARRQRSRPAHVRAEDLRQRRPRRGRNGDADRRHPPRAGDQRARHRARGRPEADQPDTAASTLGSLTRSTATRSGSRRSGIRMATTTSSSTNNMWRKNRRVLTGGVGVDQNRNYAQAWSTSCAGSTSSVFRYL